MQEVYNKNVEVYDKDSVKAPKPLGNLEASVPVLRLSFHGNNHYNSVVDPAHPPPLGDGKDSKVNLRELRIKAEEEEKRRLEKAAKAAKRKNKGKGGEEKEPSMSRLSSASVGRRSAATLLLRQDTDMPDFTHEDFDTLWSKVVGRRKEINAEELEKFVQQTLSCMYNKRAEYLMDKAKTDPTARSKKEVLDKAYDEELLSVVQLSIDLMSDLLDEEADTDSLFKRGEVKDALFRRTISELNSALDRGCQ